jgi:glycosyltransferase involved in cell wall biosynthesis
MNDRVTAYIPCFNNARSIVMTIEGIQKQTKAVDELFVVDDGSTDDSVAVVESLGIRVIRMGANKGRGAARASAMLAAKNEIVMCCDATNRLATNFLEAALRWFSDNQIQAVYGRLFDRNPKTAVDRWRARHLFHQDAPQLTRHRTNLSTYAAVMRKSGVIKAGNYNSSLRHGEDFELGGRLAKVGDIVFDPNLEIEPVISNTLFQVMERYSRWNRAWVKTYTLNNFIDSHVAAWKILIPDDIRKGDWMAALISAASPYFSLAYADKKTLSFSLNGAP